MALSFAFANSRYEWTFRRVGRMGGGRLTALVIGSAGGGGGGGAVLPGGGPWPARPRPSSLGRLQYVPVLGDHQHRHEVHDGQRQELSLLRLFLKHARNHEN